MDELNRTLSSLQQRYKKFNANEKTKVIDSLKNFISKLENSKEQSKDVDISDATNRSSLKLTIKKHKPLDLNTTNYEFSCKECFKQFATMKKMILHVLSSHEQIEMTCKECKGTFSNYSLLLIHECFYSCQTLFIKRKCGICSCCFTQRNEYQNHLKTEHHLELAISAKSFNCLYCSLTFKLRSQMLLHVSQYHKESNNILSTQRNNNNLNHHSDKKPSHQKSHTKSNEHKLKKPLRASKSKSRRRNLSESSSCSSSAGSSFTSQSNCSQSDSLVELTNQRKQPATRLTININRPQCRLCQRSFISQKALTRHNNSYNHKIKSGQLEINRKYNCDLCDRSYPKLHNLQNHISSHHNELIHKCSLCDYRTGEKCNLAEHMRRHYQIRNFSCEFCNARFVAKRELKDHIAFKHSSTLSFECTDCGKMFKTRRVLTRHRKIHLDIRPCLCACGASFLRLSNLRRHMVVVHRESDPKITRTDSKNESGPITWFGDSSRILVKVRKPKRVSSNVSDEELVDDEEEEEEDDDDAEQMIIAETIETICKNKLGVEEMSVDQDKFLEHSLADATVDATVDGRLIVEDSCLATEKQLDGNDNVNEHVDELDDEDEDDEDEDEDDDVLDDCDDEDDDVECDDDGMNICDLVASPVQHVKADNGDLGSYKVDSIIMESADSRSIWRPMDQPDSTSMVTIVEQLPSNNHNTSNHSSSSNNNSGSGTSYLCGSLATAIGTTDPETANASSSSSSAASLMQTHQIISPFNEVFLVTAASTSSLLSSSSSSVTVVDSNMSNQRHHHHHHSNLQQHHSNLQRHHSNLHQQHHTNLQQQHPHHHNNNITSSNHNNRSMESYHDDHSNGNNDDCSVVVANNNSNNGSETVNNWTHSNTNYIITSNEPLHHQHLQPQHIIHNHTAESTVASSSASYLYYTTSSTNSQNNIQSSIDQMAYFDNQYSDNQSYHHHQQSHPDYSIAQQTNNNSAGSNSILFNQDMYPHSLPQSHHNWISPQLYHDDTAPQEHRVLSPIDFLVNDPLFNKSSSATVVPGNDYCISNEFTLPLDANPLLSDTFCSQLHPHHPSYNSIVTHHSISLPLHHPHHHPNSSNHPGPLISKNFSVVNLISTRCPDHSSNHCATNKDTADELLYSESEENPL